MKRASLDHTLEVLVRNFSQAVMTVLRDQTAGAAPARRATGGGAARSVPLPARLDWLEEQAIDAALESAGGNRTRAAEILGINRVTLYKKLLAREAEGRRGGRAPAQKAARGRPRGTTARPDGAATNGRSAAPARGAAPARKAAASRGAATRNGSARPAAPARSGRGGRGAGSSRRA